MKAIILNEFGDTGNLVMEEMPKPEIKEDEVLVKVAAISVNPVDTKTRKGEGLAGMIKENDPLILGWDISGAVVENGGQASKFEIDDDVFGMVNFPGHGKCYAEYVAVPESHLAKKPENVSHENAAAATLATLTAWQAIFDNAKVELGDRVLIHAASGGVGHYAVQIAKHLGAYVIGTSSAKNKDFVMEMGADEHIDYRSVNFEEVARDMDFVLDTIGGEHIDRSMEVVKTGGTLISIPSPLTQEQEKKAKEKGIKAYFILVESNGENMNSIAKMLADGAIKSCVSETFKFDQMAEAHLQSESGRTVGKIVVIM